MYRTANAKGNDSVVLTVLFNGLCFSVQVPITATPAELELVSFEK